MTLTEFLLERIAEDEQAAYFAGGGVWTVEYDNPLALPMVKMPRLGPLSRFGKTAYYEVNGSDDSQTFHIGRHHPARILAECEAKRQIVLGHPRLRLRGKHEQDPEWVRAYEESLRSLLLLASVYADHPDYDQAWRP